MKIKVYSKEILQKIMETFIEQIVFIDLEQKKKLKKHKNVCKNHD